MPQDIMKKRLLKALWRDKPESRYMSRGRDPKRKRRGPYTNGVKRYTENVSLKLTPEQKARLVLWRDRLNMESGVLLRDALDLYLWLLEQEHNEAIATWAPERALRHPNYKRRAKMPTISPIAPP